MRGDDMLKRPWVAVYTSRVGQMDLTGSHKPVSAYDCNDLSQEFRGQTKFIPDTALPEEICHNSFHSCLVGECRNQIQLNRTTTAPTTGSSTGSQSELVAT